MRVMVVVKATLESESGLQPSRSFAIPQTQFMLIEAREGQ
jgi:hypothetical protein